MTKEFKAKLIDGINDVGFMMDDSLTDEKLGLYGFVKHNNIDSYIAVILGRDHLVGYICHPKQNGKSEVNPYHFHIHELGLFYQLMCGLWEENDA